MFLMPVFVFNLAIDRPFHCSSLDNSIGYNPVQSSEKVHRRFFFFPLEGAFFAFVVDHRGVSFIIQREFYGKKLLCKLNLRNSLFLRRERSIFI